MNIDLVMRTHYLMVLHKLSKELDPFKTIENVVLCLKVDLDI